MWLFANKENNCYLNSVLQAILVTKSANIFFQRNSFKNPVIQSLMTIFNSKGFIIDPIPFKRLLSTVDQESHYLFGNYNQQDAHEAIIKLLDIIHLTTQYTEKSYYTYGTIDSNMWEKSFSAWKKYGETFGFSFITTSFSGQFKTTVSCRNPACDYSNCTFETFNNINLPITGPDVYRCIIDYIKTENMHDTVCDKCKQKQVVKTSTIWKYPMTLILNIKRFVFQPNGSTKKITDNLFCDNTLKFFSDKKKYTYKLSSVIYHHGKAPHSGHYNTDVFDEENDRWLNVDDCSRNVTQQPGNSNSCYVLIYDRVFG